LFFVKKFSLFQKIFNPTAKLTCRYEAPVCPCPTAGGDRQASGIAVRWSDLLVLL